MRINKEHWLKTKPIAHRGLWGNGVIENSISAYTLATQKGYPIEIDLYLTKDNHLVSFHDATLERMTGEKGYIYDKTLKEIKELRLLNSDEKIPTLDEILSIAKGKSPLLIEIKPQPNSKVVDEIVAKLKNYQGEFAIQSFNPLYIDRVKKLAPEFIRGILTTADKSIKENFIKKYIVKKMPFNFIIKPDFISCSFNDLPIKNKKKLPILAWTVTDEKTREKLKGIADNIIFENFIPN